MKVRTVKVGHVTLGGSQPLALIAGPCVIESRKQCLELAGRLARLAAAELIPFIFKASFDKANRSSHASFRGPGLVRGLDILAEVKSRYGVPVLTDVHNENEVPLGINRRRVVTLNDGKPGERSVSMACMHCTDAPCAAVCPVNCFYTTADAVVLHSKDLCIGCGYCFYACPFGAPQYPKVGNFGTRGKMDKCTFCAGGPEANGSQAEFEKYGRNRLAEGKLPVCAEMCSTKALIAGDGDVVADIFRSRVLHRGKGAEVCGCGTAYGSKQACQPGVAAPEGAKS